MLPINFDLSCSMLARFTLRRRRFFIPPPPHFTRLNASHVQRRRPSRNIHKNAKPMRRKCVFQPSLNINFNSSLSFSFSSFAEHQIYSQFMVKAAKNWGKTHETHPDPAFAILHYSITRQQKRLRRHTHYILNKYVRKAPIDPEVLLAMTCGNGVE